MKPYSIEIENDIEYVVIEINDDEHGEWKKFIKENFEFLKKPDFKLSMKVKKGGHFIIYTKKYKMHNEHGPAIIYLNGEGALYLDGDKYKTEEEYINELRKRILKSILDDETDD
jgi:hypothetical protein